MSNVFARILRLIAEIERLEAEHQAYESDPRTKARRAAELQAKRDAIAAEQAAEAERATQAAAGTLVDPLRADVISELQAEGVSIEVARNLTNTPEKLIAQAQRFDFV